MTFNTLLAVKDLVNEEAVTASQDITVTEAAKIMDEKKITSILLLNGDGTLVGIMTEGDIVRRVVAAGLAPNTTKTEKIMTSGVQQVPGDTSIFEARKKMTELNIKHLIVSEDGKPTGILSSAALLGS